MIAAKDGEQALRGRLKDETQCKDDSGEVMASCDLAVSPGDEALIGLDGSKDKNQRKEKRNKGEAKVGAPSAEKEGIQCQAWKRSMSYEVANSLMVETKFEKAPHWRECH